MIGYRFILIFSFPPSPHNHHFCLVVETMMKSPYKFVTVKCWKLDFSMSGKTNHHLVFESFEMSRNDFLFVCRRSSALIHSTSKISCI